MTTRKTSGTTSRGKSAAKTPAPKAPTVTKPEDEEFDFAAIGNSILENAALSDRDLEALFDHDFGRQMDESDLRAFADLPEGTCFPTDEEFEEQLGQPFSPASLIEEDDEDDVWGASPESAKTIEAEIDKIAAVRLAFVERQVLRGANDTTSNGPATAPAGNSEGVLFETPVIKSGERWFVLVANDVVVTNIRDAIEKSQDGPIFVPCIEVQRANKPNATLPDQDACYYRDRVYYPGKLSGVSMFKIDTLDVEPILHVQLPEKAT